MKKYSLLAFALLITTTGCVTGPPVESRAERRVERSLEDTGRNHPDNVVVQRDVVYTEGYRNSAYHGYPYYQSYRSERSQGYPYYQGYREVRQDETIHENRDINNYDQEHDRFYNSK